MLGFRTELLTGILIGSKSAKLSYFGVSFVRAGLWRGGWEVFRCQSCNKLSRPNEPATTIVVETRMHTFPWRKDANRFRVGSIPSPNGVIFRPAKLVTTNDRGGVGNQIVREIKVCVRCRWLFALRIWRT